MNIIDRICINLSTLLDEFILTKLSILYDLELIFFIFCVKRILISQISLSCLFIKEKIRYIANDLNKCNNYSLQGH
jgi:hypothetical protein